MNISQINKLKKNHNWVCIKIDDKQSWKEFFLSEIKFYNNKFGLIPDRIYMNPSEISWLKNAPGVEFRNNNIEVKPKKTCLEYHLEFQITSINSD